MEIKLDKHLILESMFSQFKQGIRGAFGTGNKGGYQADPDKIAAWKARNAAQDAKDAKDAADNINVDHSDPTHNFS